MYVFGCLYCLQCLCVLIGWMSALDAPLDFPLLLLDLTIGGYLYATLLSGISV